MFRFVPLALVGLASFVATADAQLLTRDHFDGVEPETFDDFAGMSGLTEFDFGPFSVMAFWFDMFAFSMPYAPPVDVPAPGGESFTIVLDPPVVAIGFDLGIVDWAAPTIDFYGEDASGAEVLLESFAAPDVLGSGPSSLQGFIGYQGPSPIHRVSFGPGDSFFDNVYLSTISVPVEASTWSDVKSNFR